MFHRISDRRRAYGHVCVSDEIGTLSAACVLLHRSAQLCCASVVINASVVSAARKAGNSVRQLESLEEVLPETDVLYVTRVQKERFANESEWQKVKDLCRVAHALLSRAKEDMIVLHPLPRVNSEHRAGVVVGAVRVLTVHLEIDPEVDFDSRPSVYFRQMRYGLFVRILLAR